MQLKPKRDKEGSTKRTSLPSLPEGIDKKESHYAQENVNAVKYFLEKSGVRTSDTCDSLGRTKHQDESQGIGARQISDFLNDTISKIPYRLQKTRKAEGIIPPIPRQPCK